MFVTRKEHQALQARIEELEKLFEQHGLDGKDGTTTAPTAETKPTETKNEAGYCPGDIVKAQWDREYFTGKRNRFEGKEAKIYAVTAKFVRVQFDDGEKKSKRNHNASLIKGMHSKVSYKDGNGNQRVKHNKKP